MKAKIHPTAIIHAGAEIGNNCTIGPHCIISGNVKMGTNNILHNNVVLDGPTEIGDNNRFYSFAVIGTDPQDLKYKGDATRLRIGNNNTIREFCTINRSNELEEDTVVGNGNLLMEYVHIAHNCQIGNNCIIANVAQLAGHVHVHDHAVIGGMTAIHQFVHIGMHAFLGGASAIKKDIVPFSRGQGNPYQTVGLNSVGLMRKGFSAEDIASIKEVYNIFYRSGLNTSQALEKAEALELNPWQKIFVDFVKASDRGISH